MHPTSSLSWRLAMLLFSLVAHLAVNGCRAYDPDEHHFRMLVRRIPGMKLRPAKYAGPVTLPAKRIMVDELSLGLPESWEVIQITKRPDSSATAHLSAVVGGKRLNMRIGYEGWVPSLIARPEETAALGYYMDARDFVAEYESDWELVSTALRTLPGDLKGRRGCDAQRIKTLLEIKACGIPPGTEVNGDELRAYVFRSKERGYADADVFDKEGRLRAEVRLILECPSDLEPAQIEQVFCRLLIGSGFGAR